MINFRDGSSLAVAALLIALAAPGAYASPAVPAVAARDGAAAGHARAADHGGEQPVTGAGARVLRVCADPNNLPFSNARREGFENRIVELVARELGASVLYTWWAQRRGNVRSTLRAGLCDVIPGVASGMEMLRTTRPYYRSRYVFVTRMDHRLDLRTLDDPRLRHLRVGVQLIGEGTDVSPPAYALARRGVTGNVRGYLVTSDYREPNPPLRAVTAVESGEVDVALVWGPLGGWAARRANGTLSVAPIEPGAADAGLPLAFEISMGVRREDAELARAIDAALDARRMEVERILADFGVP